VLKLGINYVCLEDKKIINKVTFQGKYQENEIGSDFKIINSDSVWYIKEYFISFMVASHLQ